MKFFKILLILRILGTLLMLAAIGYVIYTFHMVA